ncbi:hypothetical protein AB0H07_46450 [Streptomyces sp. NPDC021354]|uniref:hypothetical protein n=1 Tax=Streptomyces sp. NPDC021354 TaxID=3154793 RepID=UPI0033D9D3EF
MSRAQHDVPDRLGAPDRSTSGRLLSTRGRGQFTQRLEAGERTAGDLGPPLLEARALFVGDSGGRRDKESLANTGQAVGRGQVVSAPDVGRVASVQADLLGEALGEAGDNELGPLAGAFVDGPDRAPGLALLQFALAGLRSSAVRLCLDGGGSGLVDDAVDAADLVDGIWGLVEADPEDIQDVAVAAVLGEPLVERPAGPYRDIRFFRAMETYSRRSTSAATCGWEHNRPS